MTITEFLLARIAEQEALVRDPRYIWSLDHPEIGAPEKVLAECEAKRRIVKANDMRRAKSGAPEHGWWGNSLETAMTVRGRHLSPSEAEAFMEEWYEAAPPNTTLRALASAYADHEDYREEWRP